MNTQQLSGKEAYKRLLTYVKPYSWVFIFTVIGFILAAGVDVVSAEFLGVLTEVLDGKRGSEWVILMPLILFAVFLVRGIGNFLGNFSIQYIGRKVVHDIRCHLFEKMLHLPNAYYSENSSGKLLSRVTYEVDQVASLASKVFKVILSEGLKAIGLLGYMFYLNWKLTILILLIGPLVAIVVGYAGRRFRKLSNRIQNAMGDLTKITHESINAHTEIKIYSAQNYEQNRFTDSSEYNTKQSIKMAMTQSINTPLVQLIIAIPLSIIVWLAFQPDLIGELTTAAFVSYFTAAGLIVKPIRALTSINSDIQKGLAASQSIFSLMEVPSEIDEGQQKLESFESSIELRDVVFSYTDENPVLKSVSLTVPKGKTVALVGRSGSGKSSLVSLIPRFYNPNSGEILIDGVNIRDYELTSLRSHIALVSQKVMLFDGDIRSNIAYGELADSELSEIQEAATSSHAKEFIEKLDNQYGSQVGNDGIQLSGGQRQRLAIARAMLKQASIMILDEATSALDSESEAFIQDAVDDLMGKTTMIVIAHRLSTIQKADIIVVMDNGEIIEQGNHETLLAKGGLYSKLHQQQFGE